MVRVTVVASKQMCLQSVVSDKSSATRRAHLSLGETSLLTLVLHLVSVQVNECPEPLTTHQTVVVSLDALVFLLLLLLLDAGSFVLEEITNTIVTLPTL